MKAASRRLADDPRLLMAFVGLALALEPSMAHAQVIVSDVTNISHWALLIVQAAAVLFVIAGFGLICTGRWFGALPMVIGIIGAAKADQVVSFLGI